MFTDYALSERVLVALNKHDFTEPTPVQAETLPHSLEGRDVLAQARTGTGKTLAFALPIAEQLGKGGGKGRVPRALVLTPTRELALQVSGEINRVAPHLGVLTVYGGTGYTSQARQLKRGVDVVVATPGRAVDYLNKGILDLTAVEIVVMDEADEMLSMGFEDELESLLQATPEGRQTLLFSATLPSWAKRLAQKHLSDPVYVNLVKQEDVIYSETAIEVKNSLRADVLSDLLYVHEGVRTIVFTHTKAEVDALVETLSRKGHAAEPVHGDLSQAERERAVGRFRDGQTSVLVGTNVAARGLDIPEVDLVVHYRIPKEASVYQHRSGRTGRAGREGAVILLHDRREKRELSGLERGVARRFKREDRPSAARVKEAKLQQLLRRLSAQSSDDKAAWRDLAGRWVEEGNVNAIAGLLAHTLGGASAPRSLLTGEEGWVTTHVSGMKSVPQAIKVLKDAGAGHIGRVSMARDGAYVDLKAADVKSMAAENGTSFKLRRVTETPGILNQARRKKSGKPSGRYKQSRP